jgi:SOS-response transcriptional repressor LexA
VTDRQKQIADYIDLFWTVHWTSPTVRQIGDAVGIHSPSAVLYQLREMVAAGILERHMSSRHRVIYRVAR